MGIPKLKITNQSTWSEVEVDVCRELIAKFEI